MKLSILIPIYNECRTVSKILEKIRNVDLKGIEKEIILVDDFSTDGTRDILKTIKDCKIYYHDKNRGKGAAVKTGLKHASGEIIIIQDADLEYDPNDYPKLLKPIVDGKSEVVYGSRFIGKDYHLFGKKRVVMPSHLIGNKILSFMTGLLYFSPITDMETCYKVFDAKLIKEIKLESNGFEIEPEITAKILKKGYKIREIPITFKPRNFSEGKKITWVDGIKAALVLLKYKFF